MTRIRRAKPAVHTKQVSKKSETFVGGRTPAREQTAAGTGPTRQSKQDTNVDYSSVKVPVFQREPIA
jgi:hypothetical protein